MMQFKQKIIFFITLIPIFVVGCLRKNHEPSSTKANFPRCQMLSAVDKRISETFNGTQVASCSTVRCRLGKVIRNIRSEFTKNEICQNFDQQSPLKKATRISLEYSGASMIWPSSLPNKKIPNVLNWSTKPQLTDQMINEALQKYTPGEQFPYFPYQVMTTDYVTKNLPKDLMVNYSRSVDSDSKCVLDHTGDCMIRSFAALTGLSYCEWDFLKFGVDHHVFPKILSLLMDEKEFNRNWLSQDFLDPKKFLENLLRYGGVGSYLVTTLDAKAPEMGHATVLIIEQFGKSIRLVSQDFHQFTQVEGLPVDFRFRIQYSQQFRAYLKEKIPRSTVFFDSLQALDLRQQAQAAQIPELNHDYLSFNALKISSEPLGVVNEQFLLPYISQLKFTPK